MEAKEKITTKDIYLKLITLEIEMDTTRKEVTEEISGLRKYFSKWLWVMIIINVIQTLIFAVLALR